MNSGPLTAAGNEANLLRVKIFSSWSEVERLRHAWERILRNSRGPTIFSTLEWLGAWWAAFGDGRRLVILAFLDANDEIAGLAPFYQDFLDGPFHLFLRRWRLVGDGSEDSDNLDLIVQSGYEEACARTLLMWLGSNSELDLCELNTLPAASVTARCLVSHLKECGWTYRLLERPCSAIDLPENWEAYLGQISPKEKSKIHYYMKRLERDHQVNFHKCSEESELTTCLEALFQLHQKRWGLRGEPGTFSFPSRRGFYEEIARSFLKRQWLEFWLLELDGVPVAAHFGFRYGDTVFSLQEGFDPSYSTASVGYVLRAYVLKQLIAQGVRHYDFLGGRNPSKERWAARVGCYKDLHFARPLSLGSFYLRLDQQANTTKEWLRTNLPDSAFQALRRVYHVVLARSANKS